MALPNILVTGTPGTGKSELCRRLSEKLGFQWQNVSSIVSENKFVEEYDEEFECPVLDEDRLLDFLEPLMQKGGHCVEYHSSEFFPERWFAAVFVIRCSTSLLYDRLQAREYGERKIKSNMECEIFQIPLDEARDAYRREIIFELTSDTEQDHDANLQRVQDWLDQWKAKHNKL
ncbi:adenylate kinase isoenzyme 6 homolog [Anopheles nili]|uniref:adenylate kinase isoenzyme 6 homolog n=1 Tax=Anopheles nili TaxID=185578 RepID=UPI00237C2C1D|nr:adenylate kinase isoenzyme 6 homolog [Anopheles nili]